MEQSLIPNVFFLPGGLLLLLLYPFQKTTPDYIEICATVVLYYTMLYYVYNIQLYVLCIISHSIFLF